MTIDDYEFFLWMPKNGISLDYDTWAADYPLLLQQFYAVYKGWADV